MVLYIYRQRLCPIKEEAGSANIHVWVIANPIRDICICEYLAEIYCIIIGWYKAIVVGYQVYRVSVVFVISADFFTGQVGEAMFAPANEIGINDRYA